MGGGQFQNMFLSSSPYHLSFDIAYTWVWMFLFYKAILNLKTRLLEENLKKMLLFFHYHLNLFICCKARLKIQFIFSRMNLFYRINCFTEWLFFKQNWIFWKGIQIFVLNKNFIWRIKREQKVFACLFLKNIFIFPIVFLHLNNH